MHPVGYTPILKELYGSDHIKLLPIVEYVFCNKSGLAKLSPISNQTVSTNTNTYEDDPNLTFGAVQLTKAKSKVDLDFE